MTVRSLFAERDAAAARLRALDTMIDAARREWSDRKGFRVPLRVEAFRREVGA